MSRVERIEDPSQRRGSEQPYRAERRVEPERAEAGRAPKRGEGAERAEDDAVRTSEPR